MSTKADLSDNNCYHVCMESTGKYWIPVFNYLENDIHVCLTHPKYVRAIKGRKTDKKDSKWIADLYKFDLVRCSFIPPKDFRQLREIARYRSKLVCMKPSEKNRIQNCMTVSNVRIASVLSDPFGKTAIEILSYLLAHTAGAIDEKAVRKLIKNGARAKSEEIIEAIKGYHIGTDEAKKLELARGHLDYLDNMITETEVGLYVRIAKAGTYLEPMMVQCALSAVKSKKQPYFAIKSFSPTDYEELMEPHNYTERVALNETNAIAFLAS